MKKREFIRCSALGLGGSLSLPFQRLLAEQTVPDDLWKWSREALFYEMTPRGVRCMICPNECTLKPDELSDCRNRISKGDKLYTIAYGNPCSVHVDPIEKKPLYHFLPASTAFSIATAGCNLACLNCQNWTISQKSPTETQNYDLMPEQVVEKAIENDSQTIAYTYSEPITFFEYTFDTSRVARSRGLRNVIVSAGYINEEPLRYFARFIDGANIDLKSFSDSIYLRLNAGKLEPVLNTLRVLKEEGIWLEITNLVVPSWTDDLDMIREMCQWLNKNGFSDVPLHFSRFHPMHRLTQLPSTPLATLEAARKIALEEGLNYVYIGNVPGSDASNTYCPSCKKLLIERKGYHINQINISGGKCNFCQNPVPGVWD